LSGRRSYLATIKLVFSNKNITAIALTSSMITLCDGGWRPFWPLYLKDVLGASVWAISFLSMLGQSERLLFQLPGGVIADSLPENQRGAGYGAYRMITSIPRIFSPLIGGYLFDKMGPAEGFRLFMFFSIFINAIVTYARYKIITETLFDEDEMRDRARMRPPLKEQVLDTMTLGRNVWVMVIVAVLSAFGARMVFSLVAIYAQEVIGLSYTQLGLVTTIGGIITATLAMPGGMISDRIGRKPIISLSRFLTPLSMFGITLASNFPQYIIAQATNSLSEALGGGGRMGNAGGPAWQALVADLVPKEKRATVMGTIGTITGVVAAPASLAGSWLWNNLGPIWPFRASAVTGLVAVGLFMVGVKEPPRKKVEKTIP